MIALSFFSRIRKNMIVWDWKDGIVLYDKGEICLRNLYFVIESMSAFPAAMCTIRVYVDFLN